MANHISYFGSLSPTKPKSRQKYVYLLKFNISTHKIEWDAPYVYSV